MSDNLRHFIFDNAAVRGEVVQLQQSYQQATKEKNYPTAIKQLLGEFLAAVSLISANLKFQGVISIQARGDADVGLIMAECSHHRHIRGIVRGNFQSIDDNASLRDILGNGTIAITIEPDKGERYQGIVPMEKADLAKCLMDYFTMSEQLQTLLVLSADEQHACGFMLQRMPETAHTDGDSENDWQHLSTLASTLSAEELLTLDTNNILHRLYHQEPLRLLDDKQIGFACSCSQDRIGRALVSLGKAEIDSIIEENAFIDVNCEFCNHLYRFTAEDADNLFSDSAITKH